MNHKKQRHPDKGGAGESASANIYDGDSTAKPPHQQHGPVSVGLGYSVTFILAPVVDGTTSLTLHWAPGIPVLRDCRRIYAKYSVARDKFLKMVLPHADGSIIRVEVPE